MKVVDSLKIDDKTVKTSGFDQDLKKSEVLIGNHAQANDIVAEAKQQTFVVNEVTTKERKRNPVPSFITSKLQQEASRKLGFPVKRTMMIAQHLYEGVEIGSEGSVGLITYMPEDVNRKPGVLSYGVVIFPAFDFKLCSRAEKAD